jgi:hypothetical protein
MTIVLLGIYSVHENLSTFTLYQWFVPAKITTTFRKLVNIIDPVWFVVILRGILTQNASFVIVTYYMTSSRCNACYIQKNAPWFPGCITQCISTMISNALNVFAISLGWNTENHFNVQNLYTMIVVLFLLQCMYEHLGKSNSDLKIWNMIELLCWWAFVFKISNILYGTSFIQYAFMSSTVLGFFCLVTANDVNQQMQNTIEHYLNIRLNIRHCGTFLFQCSVTLLCYAIYSISASLFCADCWFTLLVGKISVDPTVLYLQTFLVNWAWFEKHHNLIKAWFKKIKAWVVKRSRNTNE